MRPRSFDISRPRFLALALATAVGLAIIPGCAQPADIAPVGERSPAGVFGKPLIATPRGPAIADELVVKLAPGADEATAEALAADAGGELVWRGPYTGLYVVRFADGDAAAAGAERLAARPEVAEVTHNVLAFGTGIGTSPGIVKLQWNLPAMGIEPDPAATPRAAGVTVAVLDTGVAYEDFIAPDGTAYAQAPDLSAVPFVPGYDFINGDAHPNDDQGHGTHIAGVIAARGGIASVAPGAAILPVKVLDDANIGTELALAEGIAFATEHGADVINLSLSFSPSYFPSRYLQSVIDEAAKSGVVMVAAAGNHGQEVVTYPAAFRDVIAVGASVLGKRFHPKKNDPWKDAHKKLDRAAYSNRGYLVDVLAPGGTIDGDADDDGNPEGILAQTLAAGELSVFDYVFYAGTSQAAAQISGLAARALAENPDLSARQIRAIIGETASRKGNAVLDRKSGRGFVDAGEALELVASDAATAPRPQFFAAIRLTIDGRRSGPQKSIPGRGDWQRPAHQRWARAEVEILDINGDPVPHVTVYGTFTGGVYHASTARTDKDGIAVFRSPAMSEAAKVVAFQVEAVADRKRGVFDRPAGFLRIDSCSLELVSEFVAEVAGQGIGTSPGAPLSLRFAELDRGELASVTLLNYAWGLATVPMAVAADAQWFAATYPEAGELQILSFGHGIGESPLLFEANASFPMPREAASSDTCIDLLVTTFSSGQGIGTSPGESEGDGIGTSPGETEGDGIGTSPGETEGEGIGTSPGETEGQGIGTSPGFTAIAVDPNGNCQSLGLCDAFQAVIADIWTAAGIGTSPGYDDDTGVSEALFSHFVAMVDAYVGFGSLDYAAPVGDYGELLIAAGLGLTPFSDDEGQGVGASTLAP